MMKGIVGEYMHVLFSLNHLRGISVSRSIWANSPFEEIQGDNSASMRISVSVFSNSS
jgi:hypothetical protein